MEDSLNKKVAIAYLWSLAAKWMNRIAGIVSMLILVRILSPEDFGIAAMSNVIVTFFIMLSEVGTEKYVIKSKLCSDELLNSAWSLNLLLKSFGALLIIMFSGWLADWIQKPELKLVLLLSSSIPIIGAFKNIGLINYERDLNYFPITRLMIVVKFLVLPITIVLAFWWRSYWALVVGIIVSELLTVLGSYFIHPFRPRWSVHDWEKQWKFSKWMLVSTITGYIRSRIDLLLLGRFVSSSDVGIYRVSQEFAWLPFSEVIAPATNSLYSGISKINDSKSKLHDSISQYLILAYILVIPSSIGIFVLNNELVQLILGEKWVSSVPILGMLSMLMLSMPLNIILQVVLVSISKVKYLIITDIILIFSIITCFSWLNFSNVNELVVYTQARVMLMILFFILLLMTFSLVLEFSIKRFIYILALPMIPGLAMLMVLSNAKNFVFPSDWVGLIILVVLGMLVYIPILITTLYFFSKISYDIKHIYGLFRRLAFYRLNLESFK